MTVLEESVLEQIEKIKRADILVGIPSFRNADTIAHVVRQASIGMVRHFPGMKPVLVNADGGSTDRTREVVLETEVPKEVSKIVTPYRGIAGKGSAFKTIFEIASRLGVEVCIVVDSDLRSITPDWIKRLGWPVWQREYDFVAPHYHRYKYDGTITNSIAYPLTRALYGKRIRQPIGGDFGISGKLAEKYAGCDVWDTDIARFGIDIWMTTLALNEGYRVCQACMGVKLHNDKDPSSDLGSMFCQVCGTVFEMMRTYEDKWLSVKGSTPAPVVGDEIKEEPEGRDISLENLIDHFAKGYEELSGYWSVIMREENFARVTDIYESLDREMLPFSAGLWARVVYDFAVAYNYSHIDGPFVVKALLPLYCARTADFVMRTAEKNSFEAELDVEQGAEVFEALKGYLIQRWNQAKSQSV